MRNYIYCAGLPADIVGNYDFSGYIDNVNIYKTALSENQIRLLFKNKEL